MKESLVAKTGAGKSSFLAFRLKVFKKSKIWKSPKFRFS